MGGADGVVCGSVWQCLEREDSSVDWLSYSMCLLVLCRCVRSPHQDVLYVSTTSSATIHILRQSISLLSERAHTLATAHQQCLSTVSHLCTAMHKQCNNAAVVVQRISQGGCTRVLRTDGHSPARLHQQVNLDTIVLYNLPPLLCLSALPVIYINYHTAFCPHTVAHSCCAGWHQISLCLHCLYALLPPCLYAALLDCFLPVCFLPDCFLPDCLMS